MDWEWKTLLLTRLTQPEDQLAHCPAFDFRYLKDTQHPTHLRRQQVKNCLSHYLVDYRQEEDSFLMEH
jgi:hypothetical protein